MKEYKVKLFTFNELSDNAKSRVCDRERENTYNYGVMDQESTAYERMDTIKAFCDLFGIKYDVDYDHQYRFIKWHFNDVDMNGYEWCDDDIKGKYLLRWFNRYYYEIRSRKYYHHSFRYDENGKYIGSNHRYSRIQWIDGNCALTGVCYDEDLLQPIYDWYKNPDWDITLHDLIDNCFSRFMESWENEDDYLMSDEHISEMISANCPDSLYFENGDEFNGDVDDLDVA